MDGGRKWTEPSAYGAGPPKRSWSSYSGLWLWAILAGLIGGYGLNWFDRPEAAMAAEQPPKPRQIQAFAASQGVRARFSFCHTGGGYNCVVDGDTIWLQGQKIRIAGIDAPETHDYRCAGEKALGDRATRRLLQLVNSGTVTTSRIDRDEDRYGRKLRNVQVDGVSVEQVLVNEGLARWYGGGRRPWC